MLFVIYKTTNLINGKFYIGKHKTLDIDDSYLGSGKLLLQAVEKYGKENFKKEILFIASNEEEMNKKENEIVNENFLLRDDVYNLKLGGEGGFDFINQTNIPKFKGKKHKEETKEKIRLMSINFRHTEEVRKKISENHWSKKEPERFKTQASQMGKRGCSKSEQHKKKISESLKGKKLEEVKCPFCDKVGILNAMKRWHFENCKYANMV